jgi:hypothetical protein
VDAVRECLNLLKQQSSCGYHPSGPPASEPTALACLALTAHGESEKALGHARWLASIQAKRGSVGVTQQLDMPAWTTSLACLAWLAVERDTGTNEFQSSLKNAGDWLLSVQGRTIPRNPQIGHDPTILGWSWAADTHSWMEPTCMAVLALNALGKANHSRTREGVRMILDRLLEDGGCNFGSTVILGQATLPQMQATGLAMLALSGTSTEDQRIVKSLDYLERELDETNATASLCYGLLGLTAYRRRPKHAEKLLESVFAREIQKGASAYKLALITLANLPNLAWLPQAEYNQQLASSMALD